MSIKLRVTILNFLQFFIWGSWLISLGGYMINTLGFTGLQVGAVYATMGIASLFMPALTGIISDKWMNAERVLALCHLLGGVFLVSAFFAKDFATLYPLMLLVSIFYMPTIALDNTVSYALLEKNGFDIVKDFPPIRVWGTVGFIAAMWVVDLIDWEKSAEQLLLGAGLSFLLGIYAFTLPKCKPDNKAKGGWVSMLGLDAFVLFKQTRMVVFFIFCALIGAALQITNLFGESFLHDFHGLYPDSIVVHIPSILMSISQISETVFILTIPFFLKRFGIKKVMLMSMVAWFFRFALFGVGNPDSGFTFLILSMIVYGFAFDFFNISGSLFVEQEVSPSIRASAQGLFLLMANGIGSILGGYSSGWVVNHYTVDGVKDWPTIWFIFAGYALVIAILFALFFKYKHKPSEPVAIKH